MIKKLVLVSALSFTGIFGVSGIDKADAAGIEDFEDCKFINYTVESGDTLSEIAELFNTSVGDIMYVNGIRDADDIKGGQKLSIPIC